MSHTTVDQFEVEPTSCFSGSYTSGIMSGTLGVGRGRVIIAERNITSSLLTVVRNFGEQLSYNDFAKNANGTLALGNNRMMSFFCPDETFYDSLTPSPLEICSGSSGSLFCSPRGELLSPWSMGNPGLIQLGYQDRVYMTSSVGHSVVTDVRWLQSYPFQNIYGSLERKRTLPNLSSFSTINLLTSSGELVATEGTTGVATNSREFCLMYMVLSGSDGKIPLYPGSSYGLCGNITLSVRGTINSGGGFQDISYAGTSRETLQILFFGFGDGFRGQPDFDRVLTKVSGALSVRNQASYHKCQGWIIRGFKYGLINALPMTSRAVWRRGRYGQFRDMLEQRKTTKFFNLNPQSTNKLGLSDAAVTIKFVSGSNSFITASSPTTLNPSDSGLYDFEGKSGQPWYDISVTF
jgi:hypothetical protein